MANFQYSIASHISESFPSAEILKRPKSVTVIGLSLPVTLKGNLDARQKDAHI
jgi:hypothetical protein